jgi:hypothetical protein
MDNGESNINFKNVLGLIFTSIICYYTFFYLYKYLISSNSNENTLNNNINNNRNNIKNENKIKQKMTININGLLFNEENDVFNIDYIYNILDKLSDKYNIFLIIKINNLENQEKIMNEILNKLKLIYENNLVYKHRILFCSTLEGLEAIIRSIDPIIHIEYNDIIVINLIRYINEFWFIKKDKLKSKQFILEEIKKDHNNNKLNCNKLIEKVLFFDDFNMLLKSKII